MWRESMNEVERIDVAAHGLKKYSEMHQEFLIQLKKAENHQEYPAGKLLDDETGIKMSVLGILLTLQHKTVCVKSHPKAVEYLLSAEYRGEEVVIFKFYLQSNYVLTKDLDGNTKFCDYNNSYLGKSLVYEVAGALLTSPIFSPCT